MKFKFIGSGDSDPEKIVVAGVEFPKGKAVNVSDELAEKLANNSHFQAVKTRGKNKR